MNSTAYRMSLQADRGDARGQLSKDRVEVFWFSEQPYGYVTDEDLNKYDSGRLGFPNTHFDPQKAHVLYNQYHEQYALADEVGRLHHDQRAPRVLLVHEALREPRCGGHLQGHQEVKIAILGNVIAVNDPVRMAEEIAMLDCFPAAGSSPALCAARPLRACRWH